MKTNKAVKMGSNLVGVEINTIQDVVKAQAAGLELVDKEGWGYDDYTIVDDESGEERKPTEQEFFDAYASAHKEQFGEDWILDTENPCY